MATRNLMKIKVALLFGGKSAEHDISVISALQAYRHLNRDKYDVYPIYITKDGEMEVLSLLGNLTRKDGQPYLHLHITLSDGSVADMPVVAGRTSWMEASLRKNPLLKTKRRRGDANIVWDMMPIDPGHLSRIETLLAKHYITE